MVRLRQQVAAKHLNSDPARGQAFGCGGDSAGAAAIRRAGGGWTIVSRRFGPAETMSVGARRSSPIRARGSN
ncbi:MAG TPA: hypothetical protein DIT03_05365, partial [Candidatus Accumulibacter sp.]|nr:hypothetical protein [Accumulibacter sp.]HCN67696.1 hypothetical protein [Accumulibacter sp.]